MYSKREIIALNIANMLHDGDFVNLGVGMPTLVGRYIPRDITVWLHGENGCVGQDATITGTQEEMQRWKAEHGGEDSDWKTGHRDLINASCEYVTLLPGGCCFDSSIAFAMARGGHLDATVLGGLQVDEEGNLANWMVPGKRVSGMGGAMDLVCGAKKVIIAMEHCTKDGEPKLLKRCTMPLTAVACVDVVVTEFCILERRGGQFVVTAMNPEIDREELIKITEMELVFDKRLHVMEMPAD